MKVFLANPPWHNPERDGRYGVRAGSRWPHFEEGYSRYLPFPFFLAYTAAVLEKNDQAVAFVDSIAEGDTTARFFQRLDGFSPDLFLLETSTPSALDDLELCNALRARRPSMRIAVAGPHHEMYAAEFLDRHPQLDFLLLGEYEYTALELVHTLSAGGPLAGVRGLIHRDPVTGLAVVNPRRHLIDNLDDLPYPARHFLPMDRYCDTPGGIPTPSLQIIASRGCPFECIFCSWPQIMYGSHRYRVRSAGDILGEIEQCRSAYRFRSVYFDDDTFNIGEQRVVTLCDEFIRSGFDLPWAIMARADTMTEAMLVKMQQAGLQAVKYGVESSDQEILDRTKKRLDLKKAERMIRFTKSLGIKVHLTFCFGLPGENRETINRTIDYSLAMDPDSAQYSIVTPYPGSEYFDMLDNAGLIRTKNWRDYDGSSRAVFETECLTREDLEKALKVAYLRWSMHDLRRNMFRKFFVFLGQGVRHPVHGARYIKKVLFSPKNV